MDEASEGTDEPRTPFREWPDFARYGVYGVIVLVLALLVVVVAGVVTVRQSFPQVDGEVRLAGISGEIEIRRDRHGIPQVYADTAAELFFAQGYVQAQDRFFQMDFRRHLSSGRLSELVGIAGLDSDQYVRTMGWRRVAEDELRLLAPETRAHLESFSAGVNAWLEGRGATRRSLEYVVLGLGGLDYRPADWTPVDSLAWLKSMAWDLDGNLQDEIDRARLSIDHSPEEIAELYPEARGTSPDSSGFVVAGRHTTTGLPMLANAPLLEASIPSAWYQMGLHCREIGAECPFDVSGFTSPGLPGVIAGHNRQVAWGISRSGADVADLYLEKVVGASVLDRGRMVPLTRRDETIRIAGHSSKTITVRSSRHGPLLSDVSAELSSVGANAQVPDGSPARGNGYAVALAWSALVPSNTADGIFALNAAADGADVRAAAGTISAPTMDLVYAGIDGGIGYQAAGRLPVRPRANGLDPVPGWRAADDWAAKPVPAAKLTGVHNPAEGVLLAGAAAREGGGPVDQRLLALLDAELETGKVDAADMMRIQQDTRHAIASDLVPELLKLPAPSPYVGQGQQVLSKWDYQQDADSPGAAYFNAVWRNLLRLTFHDQLRDSLWPEGGARWVHVVRGLLDRPDDDWWDDTDTADVVEDRDTILGLALAAARDDLTREVDVDPDEWTWGQQHELRLRNRSLGSSESGLARALFNRGPWHLAGGTTAVLGTSWSATAGYEATTVPSMRMVVNLADLDASRWINLTGASGHAFNAHYRDQTQLWAAGGSLPWPWSREEVERQTESVLRLVPSD